MHCLCASGLRDEPDLAMRLQTLCKHRWHELARLIAAKTTPMQFCIVSASGGSGVSADSHMPEKTRGDPFLVRGTVGVQGWELPVGAEEVE